MTVTGSVVVTGAAGALGRAIAVRLLEEPIDLLVLADLDQDAVQALALELSATTTSVAVLGARVDVGDRGSVAGVVQQALDATGRLDVLINNAGVLSPSGRVHNLSEADWDRCLRVNLMGAVNGIWAAVPPMRSQGGGSIINTASVAGVVPFPYASAYSASKAAVISLTKAAAVEYARDRIRVNCVCPGTFRSAIHEGLPEEALAVMAEKHPLGLGTADQIAGAFAYLSSRSSSWTTGTELVVDGGYSSQ